VEALGRRARLELFRWTARRWTFAAVPAGISSARPCRGAAYLGEVEFDIHGGGLDLIFPHHENEIAQSRCAHGTSYGQLLDAQRLPSGRRAENVESLGNFFTINELLETESFGGRKWPGEVLRLAMLMTHYREPIDFSVRKLEEAENTLRKWKRAADTAVDNDAALSGEMLDRLADDLGTYSAFQALTDLASASAGQEEAAAVLKASLEFLGFSMMAAEVDSSLLADQVARRLAFIIAKDWASADRIRDELLAQGIQLKDSKDPATGERITTWEVKR
jgi:cysteinyl-tRNA synthetase